MRLCGEVSRRRRKLFGTAAMDTRAPATEARCDLVGAPAGHGQCPGGPVQDQKFSASIAVARIGGTGLFAFTEAGGGLARPWIAAMDSHFLTQSPSTAPPDHSTPNFSR